MARTATELTAPAVERRQTPGMHAVGEVAGLHLQVVGHRHRKGSTGVRTLILRYLLPTTPSRGTKGMKARRDFGLGAYSQTGITLGRGRAKAMEAREMIRLGKDPIDEAAGLRSAQLANTQRQIAYKEAVAGYIKAHKGSWTEDNEETWERSLRQYTIEVDAADPARKRIGELRVKDIGTSEVLSVLTPI